MSTRRGALIVLALAGRAWAAAGDGLAAPQSLARSIEQALARRKALVVLASLDGCPHCRLVRENYLRPLAREGQPVVQLDLRSAAPVADARGAATTHDRLLRAWAIEVAPTVLFLGARGQEVAPRLAGVPLADFYGAYLDERLAAANRAAGARA
jgi:hypothetical protein